MTKLVEETGLLHYDSDKKQTFSHKTEKASRTLLIVLTKKGLIFH